MAKQSGYVNGSNVLVGIAGKAAGHCTSHTATFTTETSEVKVKPPKATPASIASKFKSKRITGLGVQVKVDGLQFHSETEAGFKEILGRWILGASVELALFERENDDAPYCSGNFVISTLENTAPAGEDASYSATFDNDGPVDIDETKVDLLAAED